MKLHFKMFHPDHDHEIKFEGFKVEEAYNGDKHLSNEFLTVFWYSESKGWFPVGYLREVQDLEKFNIKPIN